MNERSSFRKRRQLGRADEREVARIEEQDEPSVAGAVEDEWDRLELAAAICLELHLRDGGTNLDVHANASCGYGIDELHIEARETRRPPHRHAGVLGAISGWISSGALGRRVDAQIVLAEDAQGVVRPMCRARRRRTVQGMLSFSLITRPGRAVAIVAVVGLLFAAQGVIALRWPQPGHGWGVDAYAGAGVLAAALLAAIAGISVLAPLHSRLGTIGVWIVRIGLAGPLLAACISLAAGRDMTLGLVWVGAATAAPGIAAIVFARRREADLPAGLLEAALIAAAAGPLVAGRGGCLLAGAAWLGIAAALWSSYLATEPGLGHAPVRT